MFSSAMDATTTAYNSVSPQITIPSPAMDGTQPHASSWTNQPDVPVHKLDCPIDMGIFKQILELDDDEEREFSRGMVYEYFDQAVDAFGKMDKAYNDKNLVELSSLGHFLKGSSATLGIFRVQASCELIQRIGQPKAEKEKGSSGGALSEEDAYAKMKLLLDQVQEEYMEAEIFLRDFYGDDKSNKILPAN